ncbi:hypothetical protein OBBRIDRAFT_804071 [Obba rivulosa]|uniref:Uncharacterized protein n=1 Tax=Obba rivulosa TaxID=1052685 RepID=A0A8E2DJD1_9APHY|nr:hypothetical protein OBBRIDRAFT_804071 [Obba rivulosa]
MRKEMCQKEHRTPPGSCPSGILYKDAWSWAGQAADVHMALALNMEKTYLCIVELVQTVPGSKGVLGQDVILVPVKRTVAEDVTVYVADLTPSGRQALPSCWRNRLILPRRSTLSHGHGFDASKQWHRDSMNSSLLSKYIIIVMLNILGRCTYGTRAIKCPDARSALQVVQQHMVVILLTSDSIREVRIPIKIYTVVMSSAKYSTDSKKPHKSFLLIDTKVIDYVPENAHLGTQDLKLICFQKEFFLSQNVNDLLNMPDMVLEAVPVDNNIIKVHIHPNSKHYSHLAAR